jgi:hypothetical protein
MDDEVARPPLCGGRRRKREKEAALGCFSFDRDSIND